MGTAAKLNREFTGLYNADNISVFFAEQRHCAHFLRFFNRHFLRFNGNSRKNDFVNKLFGLGDFLLGKGGEMREVKTDKACVNKLSCLLNVGAERFAKSRLKKMCRRMIALYSVSLVGVNLCRNGGIHRKAFAAYKPSVMKNNTVSCLGCCGNLKHGIAAGDCAGITDLTAAFAVKRGTVKNERCSLSLRDEICLFAVNNYCKYLAFACKRFIADKSSLFQSLCHVSGALPGFSPCVLTGGTCHFSVFFNKALEFFLVNAQALFGKKLFCQVNREAVGILKLEGIGARKHLAVKIFNQSVEHLQSGVNRLCKAFLLRFDHLDNQIVLFNKVRVCAFVFLDNGFADLIKERAVDA